MESTLRKIILIKNVMAPARKIRYLSLCFYLPTCVASLIFDITSVTYISSVLLQLKTRVVTIDSYAGVKSNDEKALLEAVAAQPVSVGICGSERAFQLYSKVTDTPKLYSLNVVCIEHLAF